MNRISNLFGLPGVFSNSRSVPPKTLLLISHAALVAVLGTSIVSACGPHWNPGGGGSHSGGAGGKPSTDAGSAGSSADSGGSVDSGSADATDSSFADAAGDAPGDAGSCVRQTVSVEVRTENGLCLIDLPSNIDRADPLYFVAKGAGVGGGLHYYPLPFDPTTCEPGDGSFDARVGWAPYSSDTVRICGFICENFLPILYGGWLTCGATRSPGQAEGPVPTKF